MKKMYVEIYMTTMRYCMRCVIMISYVLLICKEREKLPDQTSPVHRVADHGTPSPLELLAYHRYVSLAMEKRPESKLVVQCEYIFYITLL